MNTYKPYLLLLLLASLFQENILAQYGITPMLPPDGIYLKSQLWNVSVSNTSNSSPEGMIQMSVKSVQTRQVLFTATSASFDVSPGVHTLQFQALQPIAYNYSAGITMDQSPGGLLPAGVYQVCYQLVLRLRESVSPVAEQCEDIDVQPMGPPLLVTPEDTSLVTGTTPAFSWLPPSPAGMFTGLSYDLILSEVHKGQSVTDAIQYNLPLQQGTSLQQPFWVPTLQGPPLEPGKRYAWQVVAHGQTGYLDKSEVWSFRTADSLQPKSDSGAVYLLMDDRLTGTSAATQGVLHIKYYSSALPHRVTLVINNEQGIRVTSFRKHLQEGDNYLDFLLDPSFKTGQAYTAVLTDQGVIHSLHFVIK